MPYEITGIAMPPEIQQRILSEFGKGKPGLSYEQHGIVYRDPKGNPIAVVTLFGEPNGTVRVGAVVIKGEGLLKGKATAALIDEVKKIPNLVLPIAIEMSPEGMAFYKKIVGKIAVPKAESGSPSYLKEPFIKVGDRVRYIDKIKGRSGTWPEGVWLEKGMEGTVIEYHPRIPAPPIPGEEPIEDYAVVKFDNGASSAIDSKDEGERWGRVRDATSTHPLVLKRYPLGAVPEKIPIGGLDVPIPPLRGTELPPKKPKVVVENAVLRTNEKFDSSVKHLGYEPVNLSQEELEALDKPIPTDVEIINDSQKRLRSTAVVPDEKLNSRQLSHLKLARVIARDIFHTPVSIHAAIIPPASERVRTAGLYETTTRVIYLNLDQLSSGRNTVDTLIHELGHHQQYQQTNKAEDLSPEHAEAMTLVASRVVDDVSRGKFDELLKEIFW